MLSFLVLTEIMADKFALIPLDSDGTATGGGSQSTGTYSKPETIDTSAPEDDDLPF